MYVCLCNAVSDKTLREAVRRYQPKSIQQLRQLVPVGKQCGKCIRVARETWKTSCKTCRSIKRSPNPPYALALIPTNFVAFF